MNKKRRQKYIRKILKNKHIKQCIKNKHDKPEKGVGIFFVILGIIIIIKLITLQGIQTGSYKQIINNLHYKESSLSATRGDIFIQDKGGNNIQVTKNITLYDLYIEPQYFEPKNEDGTIKNPQAATKNKKKFIEMMTPYFYRHLCEQLGVLTINQETCVKNLEIFTRKDILPKAPDFFYTGSGTILDASGTGAIETYGAYNRTGYNTSYAEAVSGITQQSAYELIAKTLDQKISIGTKESNYVGFFTNDGLLQELAELPYVTVYENYVYIQPDKVDNHTIAERSLIKILNTYEKKHLINHTTQQLKKQENKYIKLLTKIHPDIANEIMATKKEYNQWFYQCQPSAIKKLTNKYKNENTKQAEKDAISKIFTTCKERESRQGESMTVPFLHGLGLENYDVRYYPYGNFLSHVLGFVNSAGQPLYGIEEYMNETLKGIDGKIIGRSSGVIGSIGANDFEVENARNGSDVFLTIDQNIQKYIEEIIPKYQNFYRADSISVIVMEPDTGKIRAMANTPTFNPNNFNSAFRYKPLHPDQFKIADNEEYIDTHLFVQEEDGTMRKATTTERSDPAVRKRIAENTYGSEVFVDKNIKYAYEPGSVFKPLTVAIGIDSDEIGFDDYYRDEGEAVIEVTDKLKYTIRNVSSKCLGDKTYLNALTFSCNVGMIRIIQKIGKPIFYNYLDRLGFGKKTGIELAGEEAGFIEKANTTSVSRFLNNAFGLGMKTTPMQLAQGFATLLNGGDLIKPTLIEKIYNKNTDTYDINEPLIIRKIFREDVANQVKDALFAIVEGNPETQKHVHLEGFSLGGKTGTAEIAYKGKYRGTEGRTNASFIGVVTQEKPEYIVVVQIRRPKTNKWGTYTAGPVFKDIAGFLIAYDLIQE